MKLCSKCNRQFDDQAMFCLFDASPLSDFVILDDKYRLEEPLGKGGMGQVYLATHINIGTKFAVKILHPEVISDETNLKRFQREAQAAAQIHHPNAVTVTDFGVAKDSNIVYLVMEFLEGITLREKLKQEKQLSYQEIWSILYPVSSAVQAAHNKGIVHRDLKPDNIYIAKIDDGLEIVKVLDFGIAKLVKGGDAPSITQTGALVGTPIYMSPEQCGRGGGVISSQSDIYSLGIILYEMLAGQVPFLASSPTAVVLMHLQDKPKSLQPLRPDIPKPVEEVVMRALEKEPKDRQQSVSQLADEFFSALEISNIELSLDKSQMRTRAKNTSEEKIFLEPKNLTVENLKINKNTQPIISSKTIAIQPKLETFVSVNQTIASEATSPKYSKLLIVGILILIITIPSGWYFYSNSYNKKDDRKELPTPIMPSLIEIKATKFNMGNNKGDVFAQPEHESEIKPFQAARFLVTNSQYGEFIKQSGYQSPTNIDISTLSAELKEKPITNITWKDANAYCKWLSTKTGKPYRLLSESEWEYLARNYVRFGIDEILGNYVEWTGSQFSLYPGSKAKIPDQLKQSKLSIYILRGKNAESLKDDPITYRSWQSETYSSNNLGFRLVCDQIEK